MSLMQACIIGKYFIFCYLSIGVSYDVNGWYVLKEILPIAYYFVYLDKLIRCYLIPTSFSFTSHWRIAD